ncbi:uncharacterized protein LOC134840329 [Symsagittifera roscoffensis]|uniref:uncharacterized protein LOC134840329 n=1 Tax=Symsagittifera roscoffensis TaxID=84072 RepID=UPI00307BDDEB
MNIIYATTTLLAVIHLTITMDGPFPNTENIQWYWADQSIGLFGDQAWLFHTEVGPVLTKIGCSPSENYIRKFKWNPRLHLQLIRVECAGEQHWLLMTDKYPKDVALYPGDGVKFEDDVLVRLGSHSI